MRNNPVILYQADTPAPAYLPFPRFLIQNENLCRLSNDAKVLYALLFEKQGLGRSAKITLNIPPGAKKGGRKDD